MFTYRNVNGVRVVTLEKDNFTFEYGYVVYRHRFSIKRSLDDYVDSVLNKCIRMGVHFKYYTMARDDLVPEMQILYKDENNKVQCLCLDLREYNFEILHVGNMQVNI